MLYLFEIWAVMSKNKLDVQDLLLGAVAKIDDRQTGSCYFVSNVWVLKATLCAAVVALILITYPTNMGMAVTSFKVHSHRNSTSCNSKKLNTTLVVFYE